MDVKMNRRSQINIFIIIGIVLVGAIVFFFIFKGGIKIPGIGTRESSPDLFLESCIESKIKEAVNIMLPNGGYINPEFYFKFKFEKEKEQDISYLCYTGNYYVPCVNQEPMLLSHLREEIENYIEKDVEDCFESFVYELKRDGYEVNSSYNGFEVELIPKKILVNIYGDVITENAGERNKQEDFEVRVPTRFYDLAVVVQEILSQEAEYCNFEQVGFMLLNPEFELDKFKTGNSDTIYTLKHRTSGETFRFAVRGCAIPAGM